MELLRSFKGRCGGIVYRYELTLFEDELTLTCIDDNGDCQSLDWDYSSEILKEVHLVCDKLESRL